MYVLRIWKRSPALAVIFLGLVLVTILNGIWVTFHTVSPAQLVMDGMAGGGILGIAVADRLLAGGQR